VVDIDPRALTQIQNRLDIRTVQGNGAHPSILKSAGAEDADLLLAVTDNDEVNMVACQVAESFFSMPTKIARIRSSEYLNNQELFNDEAGINLDVVISPEAIVTNHISRLIEYPGALQVLDFADGIVRLIGIKAYKQGRLIGCPLSRLKDEIEGIETRVAAIYRSGEVITPNSKTQIQEDDEVFFIAENEHIQRILYDMRGEDANIRRIFIAGGGNIGLNLAKTLEQSGYSVKLLELDSERAAKIADQLSSTVVLNGNAADAELLVQENIEGADVFCAVTEVDEINLFRKNRASRDQCCYFT